MAGALHAIARHAYERSDPAADFDNPIIAILFSAAATEAYLSEIVYCASLGSASFPALAQFVDFMEEAEESHVQVRAKYLLAKALVSDKPFDKGSAPFQDFDLLIRLRNDLVHMKPDIVRDEPVKIASIMRAKGLCRPSEGMGRQSWMSEIATREAARWACNTAVEITESLFEPSGKDHPFLTAFVRTRLIPVQ